MKAFAELISSLETSNKTNDKIDALMKFFNISDDKDKIWLVALFTGKRPKRPVKTQLIRSWAIEIAQIPEWLFLECYSNVGDLGETISLILPQPQQQIDKPLHQWMQELVALQTADDETKKDYVVHAWSGLNNLERLLFNKLIGGSFRIGVSQKLLINALAKYANLEAGVVMHSIMGKWDVNDINFQDLISAQQVTNNLAQPFPFCLAYPLDKPFDELGMPDNWQVEYKWDGIRGQIVKRKGEVFIWSRGEELVTNQFPEIATMANSWPFDAVVDGEILAIKNKQVLNFSQLQKRLNRKTLGKKMLEEIPVGFYAYDLLEYNEEDLRTTPLKERRALLEKILPLNETTQLSTIISFSSFDELENIRQQSRTINSEGLMLKEKNSIYHSGRKRGDWWKWKVNPLTIDAVLIYAQKGAGRRSAYYTDYTFAVKQGDQLVTIAKAYSGLTDKEIMEVDRFIKKNSIEKFGPVRTVKPELVFEIAFEGIALSNRHKSGLALRFPRILRWRKDKKVEDIDTVENIKKLIVP